MRRCSSVLGCVLGMAIAVGARTASAAPASAERAQAEALFREARALMAAGNIAAACGKFAESDRLDAQLGTQLNLALCHAKEGKTASAWVEFRELAERAERARDAERATFARQQAARLEPRLARVRVVASNGVSPDLVVRLDGEVLGPSALGSALPLDPGDHTLEASAAGKTTWRQTAHLDEARTLEVTIPLLDDATVAEAVVPVAPAAPRTAPALAPKPQAGPPVLGYALVGVGVVGLGVGTLFGLRTLSKKSDADAQCPSDLCTPSGHDLEGEARTASIISTIGFGAGIAGVAGGLILILTAKPKAANASIRVLPALGGVRFGASW